MKYINIACSPCLGFRVLGSDFTQLISEKQTHRDRCSFISRRLWLILQNPVIEPFVARYSVAQKLTHLRDCLSFKVCEDFLIIKLTQILDIFTASFWLKNRNVSEDGSASVIR
jgi:hypothetical protein